jgi:tRNA pseudouridine38-40 synthase
MTDTRRMAFGLQYHGGSFNGWQTQRDRCTVQDVLEKALAEFIQAPVQTTAAGRTDAGVHALGQVVHIDSPVERAEYSWVRGVNALLPPTVALQWAKPLPAAFHARFSAFERVYHYWLYVNPVRSPLLTGQAGWSWAPLDVELMRAAAQYLVGDHDFSAFRSSECQAKSPLKRVHAIELARTGDYIYVRFRANAFLHHMVRNIMGCLIAVGRGRRPVAWLHDVLEQRDRRLAAPTFMADGLYLAEVKYPAEFEVPAPVLSGPPWSNVWGDISGNAGSNVWSNPQ